MLRMRRAALSCALVGAGCGSQSTEPFLVETTECALVNNLRFDNTPTSWTDCRVYWSGDPANILTVQLTIPGTMGSFVEPEPSWARASVHVPGGAVSGELAPTPFSPGTALPTALPDGTIALDLSLPFCGNLGGGGGPPRDVTAEVGAGTASFSINLSGTCFRSGGQSTYSGGFIITAAAGDMPANRDPATIVTVP